MGGFVYILYSDISKRTYTGSTDNVLKRLEEHNSGKTKSTTNGIPWKVWYVFEYPTIEEARILEKYFKSGAGRRKLKSILEHIPKPK